MRKVWNKLLSVLLGVTMCGALGACAVRPSTPPEEEDPMLTLLKQQEIRNNRDKVVTTPTFSVDTSVSESSALVLPLQFADYMVFQANAVNCVFGTYPEDGGIAVTVKGTDYEKTFYGTVKDGAFEVYLDTVPFGTEYTVTVYTPTGRKTLSHVAFGEVYLMSGQSNMGMTMDQCLDPYDESGVCIYQNLIDGEHSDDLRVMSVYPAVSRTAVDAVTTSQGSNWRIINKKSAGDMSAVAYFFANRIHDMYGVPVGIIQSAMGGTNTCTWIPAEEYVNADPTYANPNPDGELTNNDGNTPSTRFNAMIYPLRKTTVRGVCWYQGEGQSVKYFENTSLLISGWRRTFDRADLPFHIVELPRHMAGDYDGWFSIRTQQKRLADELTNVSYSVNIDRGIFPKNPSAGIYNPGILGDDGIHCPDKEQVGIRAADAFAQKFYKATGTLGGPVFKRATLTSEGLLVEFETGDSQVVLGDSLCGFEVSNDGTHWSYATPSEYSNSEIMLRYDPSITPMHVRYGYTYSCPEVFGGMGTPDKIENLVCVYNREGYPADQFLATVQEG